MYNPPPLEPPPAACAGRAPTAYARGAAREPATPPARPFAVASALTKYRGRTPRHLRVTDSPWTRHQRHSRHPAISAARHTIGPPRQSWTSPAWPCVWRPSAAAFAAAHAADRPPREGRWRACPSALHPLYSTPRTHIPHSGTRRIRLHSTNCRCVLIRNSSIQPSVAVSCDRPLRYHSAGSCHIRSVTAWARPSSHKADAVIFHHIHGANVAHVWAAVP
jgi:hypothetical protein